MPDIELRFNKELLVLSAPLDAVLARQGIDATSSRPYLNLMEPEVMRDALRLEIAAGAQCAVTPTEDVTRARLAHSRMDADAARIAQAALDAANEVKPQHVLAEIGPCGLPLDASSKASLNENRSQYADAARAFSGGTFDAFFLNGFVSIADLKCALMGVAQVSDKPLFASVVLGEGDAVQQEALPRRAGKAEASADQLFTNTPFSGYAFAEAPSSVPVPASSSKRLHPDRWPEALETMVDLGAAVVGFETPDPIAQALAYAQTAVSQTSRPVLTQLRVSGNPVTSIGKNLVPLEDIDEYTPDTMATAAVKLYGAGVQFLRATGAATPAYTGALAATVLGLDVRRQ